jgi:hypothetical protein
LPAIFLSIGVMLTELRLALLFENGVLGVVLNVLGLLVPDNRLGLEEVLSLMTSQAVQPIGRSCARGCLAKGARHDA